MVAVGEVGVGEKNWEFEKQTSKQRIDKQQGPILQHRGLHSISWDKP